MTSILDFEPTANELSMRSDFERWLRSIVQKPEAHVRFANTLSMLEHIGSVKIARTQSGPDITEEILEHLAEETRHAQYLKRIVRKIGGQNENTYHDQYVLAGPSARLYFAKLDAVVRRFTLREFPATIYSSACYNLVSWLIERRAIWLYPAYQRALDSIDIDGVSVRMIINEETGHLEDMIAGLQRLGIYDHPTLDELVRDEEELFGRLANALMGAS